MKIITQSNITYNKPDTKNLSFGLIKLKKNDLVAAEALLQNILSSKTTANNSFIAELYRLFEPYLKKEGIHKASKFYIVEEVISELKLKFMEVINSINKDATIEYIIQKIDTYKPSKDIKRPEWQQTTSLDKPSKVTGKPRIERITEDNLPVPQSAIEAEKITMDLDSAIDSAPLTKTMKKGLDARRKGASYDQIAEDNNISPTNAYNKLKTAVLRIQSANDAVSEENKKRILDIANVLGISFDEGLKLLSKNYTPFRIKPETINKKIDERARILGITRKEFIKAILSQPQLLLHKPETIDKHVNQSAKLLNITKEEFVKAALKRPALFCMSPKTLNKNIDTIVKSFDIDRNKYIKRVIKYPQILVLSPMSIEKRIDDAAKLFNISREEFVNAALRHPSLFCISPETLNNNVNASVKLFNLPREVFIKAALISPTLFVQKPETLNNNAEASAKLLGITKERFVEATTKHPQLFYQSPETLNKNIEEIARVLNISKEECLQMALKYPKTFSMNSDTVQTRLNLLRYYKQIKNDTKNIKLYYCVSMSAKRFLNDIMSYLMKSQGYSTYSQEETIKRLPEILSQFKESPCVITMPAGEATEPVMKYMKECSEQIVGKNVFEFKIAS